MSHYHYTVHPFGDEWTWDQRTNGELPSVFGNLGDAIAHAVQVKEDYCEQTNSVEWQTTFWSAIYDNVGDLSDYNWRRPEMYDGDDSTLIGYVDPDGNFHKCFESTKIPTTPDGGYAVKGETHV